MDLGCGGEVFTIFLTRYSQEIISKARFSNDTWQKICVNGVTLTQNVQVSFWLPFFHICGCEMGSLNADFPIQFIKVLFPWVYTLNLLVIMNSSPKPFTCQKAKLHATLILLWSFMIYFHKTLFYCGKSPTTVLLWSLSRARYYHAELTFQLKT